MCVKEKCRMEGFRRTWQDSEARVKPMRVVFGVVSLFLLAPFPSQAQQVVSFPTPDGGVVYADTYGTGERGVVLAHGGRFTKEGWRPQAVALADAGFRAIAIAYRGEDKSRGGSMTKPADAGYRDDVLGAVRYLRQTGAKTVSVVGASFGGDATAEALVAANPGEIDRVVLLAHGASTPPARMTGRKLFIVARDDANAAGPRLPAIRKQFEASPEPKELVILDGSAHAQFVFQSDQGKALMREILRFLSAP
jgi:dienelactone hydrolase